VISAIDRLLALPPFGLSAEAKAAALLPAVSEALLHHHEHCPSLARWHEKRGFDPHRPLTDLADVPFLPVGVFKRLLLASVPADKVVRELTSSATSSQTPSRIPLDQVTRQRQIRALAAILSYRLGGTRRPFLVLDAPPDSGPQADRELSARVAALRGYLMAANTTEYALRRDGARLVLDIPHVRALVEQWTAEGKPFCLLGYTYMLYQYVVRPLLERGESLALPATTCVLHFGGWKKLAAQAVDKARLNADACQAFGLQPQCLCDVYGFTEQLGVIYPDDTAGRKRAPTYAEVLVRDPATLAVLPDGATGLLEFVCPLPHSYPGVAILLDDLGRIVSREPGDDGLTGTAFELVGRAARAETRGCGDTLPPEIYDATSTVPSPLAGEG
jgi:hypothetical protein